MNRLKVMSKEKIAATLLLGGLIRYINITAKVYLRDAAGELLGAIRFDTFLHWPRIGGRNGTDPLAVTREKSIAWSTGETYRLPKFTGKK